MRSREDHLTPREPSSAALRWVHVLLEDELTRQADVLVGSWATPNRFATRPKALADPLRALLGDEVVSEPAAGVVRAGPGPLVLPVSERVPMLRLGDRAGTPEPALRGRRHLRPRGGRSPTPPCTPSWASSAVRSSAASARPRLRSPSRSRGRSMLTIEEGLAFLHAVPEALEKNKCFHTGASRGTDRRVPALWISERGTAPGLVLGAQPPHLAGRGLGRGTRHSPCCLK